MNGQAAVLPAEAAGENLEERFRVFVEEHDERAVRLAWRLVGGDRAAAEDVAPDAFLAAHRGLSSFRWDSHPPTLFYRRLVRRPANCPPRPAPGPAATRALGSVAKRRPPSVSVQ